MIDPVSAIVPFFLDKCALQALLWPGAVQFTQSPCLVHRKG
jgi:hypothetical protein